MAIKKWVSETPPPLLIKEGGLKVDFGGWKGDNRTLGL